MRFLSLSLLFSIVVAALACAPSATLAAPPQYQVQELGLAYDGTSWPLLPSFAHEISSSEINSAGDIAFNGFINSSSTVLINEPGGFYNLAQEFASNDFQRKSVLRDMDDSGRIIGVSNMSIPPENAVGGFLFDSGVLTDIGNIGGGSINESSPTAINNLGQVVGSTAAYDGSGRSLGRHAFLYQDGALQDLGTFGTSSLGKANSVAMDINDLGQIVGSADVYDAAHNYLGSHPFLYDNGVLTDLGTLGADTDPTMRGYARFINNSGMIVAQTYTSVPPGDSGNRLTLFDGAETVDLVALLVQQGALPSSVGVLGLNEAGQVLLTGRFPDPYWNANWQRAFIYDHGTLTNLGSPTYVGGRPWHVYAIAMNESGDVVGQGLPDTAFAYIDGELYNLPDILPAGSPKMIAATSISDDGKILALGRVEGQFGKTYAYLLTPVPEPATLLLALCGAVAAVAMRRRFSR